MIISLRFDRTPLVLLRAPRSKPYSRTHVFVTIAAHAAYTFFTFVLRLAARSVAVLRWSRILHRWNIFLHAKHYFNAKRLFRVLSCTYVCTFARRDLSRLVINVTRGTTELYKIECALFFIPALPSFLKFPSSYKVMGHAHIVRALMQLNYLVVREELFRFALN